MMKFVTILILFYPLVSDLSGEDVTLELTGDFLPYETYYVGSIDLATGTSDVQLFNFLLSDLDGPQDYTPAITFNAEFVIEILSPELGFTEKTKLLKLITTSPIKITNPIYLDNRDFNLHTTQLLDTHGNPVPINFELTDVLEIANYEDIVSAIITMGKLPDGIYDFTINLSNFSNDDQIDIIETKTINITTPTSLNMIYPGGSLADTAQNIVFTPYPVFQWATETCISCGLFIRVAEFNPELHSSLDEAIDDVTSLPIDQIEGWEKIETVTSFQYPVIGARELEAGKLYVWQIKKELPTTLGTDAYLSTISVFKLADPAHTEQTSTQILSDPILIALKDLLGSDTFDAYFANDGELANYNLKGAYRINNENFTSNDILQILDQLKQGTISVINLSVE